MKKSPLGRKTKLKQSHTSQYEYGMGDNYGTGKLNPVAKEKTSMMKKVSLPKSLKKPPKSLA